MAEGMPGPLDGLRVLELTTGVAGPYAGRLFAMLGATVVKVEPPGGDPARRLAVDHRPVVEPSPVFIHLNVGKVLVDGGESTDPPPLVDFDVVIAEREPDGWREGFVGVLATVTAWGLDADDPGRPSDELLVQASSGLMTNTGDQGRAPLRFPGWQSQYLAGGYAAAAALAALGDGGDSPRHVDVTWVAAMLTGAEGAVCAWLNTATAGGPEPSAAANGAGRDRQAGLQVGAFPAGAFACRGGHVVPGTVRPADWVLQCGVYGRPELLEDERFDARHRWENRELLRAELEPWYAAHSKEEIFAAALDVGWAAAMVMTASDALADEHLAERHFLSVVDGPVGGRGRGAGPVVVAGQPWRTDGLADGASVALREPIPAGAVDPMARLRVPTAPPSLSSLKVLELTWAWAGPFVGRFLGAWGADVIRVETGRFPDGWRSRLRWSDTGLPIPEGVDERDLTWDAAALHNSLNRNKRTASVDLSMDEGRNVFRRLLARADVMVVNMTHHVLADRGVEDDVLAAVRDRGLVLLTMPALGATGPYRAMPGYGMLMEGMGGFAARFGYEEEGARASATYYPDLIAGLHGTIAVLAGLARREATGMGSLIDLSQQETTWLQLGEGLVLRSREGREPDRLGNTEAGAVLSGVFEGAGESGWIAVVAMDPDEVAAVDRATGGVLLPTWTEGRDADEAVATLAAVGARAARVATHASAYRGGDLAGRGVVESVNHPLTGTRDYLCLPVRRESRPLTSVRPAPMFDQHTDELLREWTGVGDDEIARLRASGAIGTTPQGLAATR